MKNISKLALASVFCAGACLSAGAQNVPVIEANIQEWLQKMTLEEKIGQMCEITIDVVTDFEASMKHGFVLDKAKLDTVIGKYKVGSLLNVPLSIAQPKEKPRAFDEGNRHTLYLWRRPNTRNYLYPRRHILPARREYGRILQP